MNEDVLNIGKILIPRVEEKINGVDTINQVDKKLAPKSVNVTFGAMKALQEAQTIAIRKWMAIIPYCVVCKVPLVWVRNSTLLFECPECGMKWYKNNGWDKAERKLVLVEHGD